MNDLMVKRFKVIADYPDSPANVGEIFTKIEGIQNYTNGRFSFDVRTLERYPHLFKELQWWEERTIDEMPKYLKLSPEQKDNYCISLKEIFKVYKWKNGFAQIDEENEYDVLNNTQLHFIPATLEEYNLYIQSKQQ